MDQPVDQPVETLKEPKKKKVPSSESSASLDTRRKSRTSQSVEDATKQPPPEKKKSNKRRSKQNRQDTDDSTTVMIPMEVQDASVPTSPSISASPTTTPVSPQPSTPTLAPTQPAHLALSHQPPCSDIAPDVFTNVMPYVPRFRELRFSDLLKFALFLVAGPIVGLTTLAMTTTITYCVQTLKNAVNIQPYVGFVILPLVLPFVVYVSDKYFLGIGGSGIPKTLLGFRLANTTPKRKPNSFWDDFWFGGVFEGHLSPHLAVGKFFLTILVIFAGGSLGPEGPMVQVGASMMSAIQKVADLPFFYPKAAIMAGAAVAISSIFNAPLAGIVFAIEEVGGIFEHYGLRVTVLSMVAIAALVTTQVPGHNEPAFGERDGAYDIMEWGAVPICGILLGLLGGCFTRLVVESVKWRKANAAFVAKWNIPFAFLMGVFVVLLASWTQGSVYGPGEDVAIEILDGASQGDFTSNLTYYLYGPFKLLSTLCCAFSGVTGGLFVPSLVVGVGWGRLFAFLCPFANPETVVIFCMISYFAGVTQGPLTSLAIARDITAFGNSHLAPALACAVVASFVSKLVCPYPFYAYLVRVGNQPLPSK